MTAATVAVPSLRERLLTILDYAAEGAEPPRFCPVCATVTADRCDECAQLAGDFAIINAGIGKVASAPGEDDAVAVWLKCLLALTGIPAAQWSVGIIAAPGGEG